MNDFKLTHISSPPPSFSTQNVDGNPSVLLVHDDINERIQHGAQYGQCFNEEYVQPFGGRVRGYTRGPGERRGDGAHTYREPTYKKRTVHRPHHLACFEDSITLLQHVGEARRSPMIPANAGANV